MPDIEIDVDLGGHVRRVGLARLNKVRGMLSKNQAHAHLRSTAWRARSNTMKQGGHLRAPLPFIMVQPWRGREEFACVPFIAWLSPSAYC
jgi:hypothetical protein